MLAKAFALLPIVGLLFSMGFFMLATPPLLILKHDTPVDARFIRGLFNIYYVVVMAIAAIGAAGCALTGQTGVALAMSSLLLFVFATRRWFISHMDRLRGAMLGADTTAPRRFKRLHVAGMILNVVQFAVVAWGMTRLATM